MTARQADEVASPIPQDFCSKSRGGPVAVTGVATVITRQVYSDEARPMSNEKAESGSRSARHITHSEAYLQHSSGLEATLQTCSARPM